MGWIREQLGVVVAAWLIGQAVAASAFALGDCCDRHRAPVVRAKSCHENAAPAASQCPMRGANDKACPMHRAASHHGHESVAEDSGPTCALSSTCAGHMATLAKLLFVRGILPPPVAVPAPVDALERAAATVEDPLTWVISPDAPPPRRSFLL
jgi:hypothetical protein